MKQKLAQALVEVLKTADAYQTYKKEHPGTKKTKSDPMFKNVSVYDNGGKTHDRYTVVHHDTDGQKHFYGMSKDPHHPQGFNQYSGSSGDGYEEGPHLGKKLKQVPEHLHKAIKERIASVKKNATDKELNTFVDYCWQFYAPGEIYGDYFDNNLTKPELIEACKKRMKDTKNWGDGDSFDREAVRDIMVKKRGKS